MKIKLLFCGLLIILTIVSTSCDIIPTDFNFAVNANIDTTSELGPETLDRVDKVNETLASGIEVGPETRDTINQLNETLANGIKAGFDEETLARVDELLRVVEDGLKIGLDDETLASIDGVVETIDQMPGNWEASAQDIIQTLESTAGSTAGRLADEVSNLMVEARINYQQMTAITGIEFRCNVDFLGSKMGSTAQEFIGKSIVGKLKRILSGEPEQQTVPTPWVCQVIPDTLILSKIGDRLVFESGIITLTGYNYVDANTPTAVIVDESGTPVPGIPLYPYRSSPYQIQLNLQDLDFSPVPTRSRIVFTWPNVSESSGIAILLPGHEAPIANFLSDKKSGNAPLTVQFTDASSGNPVQWEWVFGDGSSSLEQNPSHIFLEKRDFLVQLTVMNAQGQSSVTNTISVGTELAADFSFSPGDGDAPLLVEFKDKSKGGPTSWLWNFGDGSPASTEQNPQHLYLNTSPEGYQVTLTVQNGNASSNKSSTDRIKVMEELDAQFQASKVSGKSPLSVVFTDQSKGGTSIATRKWDFGDGTSSTLINPSHTYTKSGNFDVSLTITRTDGKQDVEVKNAYINSFKFMANLIPKYLLSSPIKDNSVFFTSFSPGAGGTQYDTKILYSKYVCGVNGMIANNGVISYGHVNKDGLRVYMYPQNSPQINQQTWWLLADFQDIVVSPYPKETWSVNVICFSRTLEGSIFLYRDDFRNISGGTPLKTGLKTSDYFNCGINGIVGRGATGFYYGNIYPIVMQATVDGSGDEWVIKSDMDVADGGDIWDTKVLCLKKGTFNNVEKPPFLTKTVTFQSSVATQIMTDISATDYICGVNGYTAELGDLYTMFPSGLPDSRNIAPNVFTMRAFSKNGYWWVDANIANRFKAEDWTVNLMCVRKPIAVLGMPPP
jgi:PKD repeat protein